MRSKLYVFIGSRETSGDEFGQSCNTAGFDSRGMKGFSMTELKFDSPSDESVAIVEYKSPSMISPLFQSAKKEEGKE